MNIQAAIAHLNQDANFKPIIEQVQAPNFAPSGKVYLDLLESIVSQQLSVKAADVIFNRFLHLFPDQHPHPHQIVALDVARLRSVGLSGQKAAYIQNVAHYALKNDMESVNWSGMSDEEILSALTQIKGVGKWTVQMLLMFTLGRPDIFPEDDLGIQQAMQRLYKIDEPTPRALKTKMREHAEPWRPWRTVACRYLWRWKDTK